MAAQGVRDLCRAAATLDEAAVPVVAGAAEGLGLLADLVAGDIAVMVPARGPGRVLTVAEGRPTVCRTLYARPRAGEVVDRETEPVVARCLDSGRFARRPYACLMGGRPVEQVAVPLRREGAPLAAVCSIERNLLNGPWARPHRVLGEAARAIARQLLGGAADARDMTPVLRMARGVAIIDAHGQVEYADQTACDRWGQIAGKGAWTEPLPQGPPPGTTPISQRSEAWGREWEFEVAGSVYRRRDLLLGAEPNARVLSTIHDVTHLHAGRWLVSSRSAAFQEIHHRIKNNLQTISSLLRMQARREDSSAARSSLRTAIGRVQSVALVHEALSMDGSDEVDLKALASTLAEAAAGASQRIGAPVTTTVLGPSLRVPAARASQIALVLNELVQNSIKHAFPEGRSGRLTVQFEPHSGGTEITVQDDGIGLPPGFRIDKTANLGLQIAQRIVTTDLGGDLKLHSNGGTTAVIRLPSGPAKEETCPA